MIILSLPSHTVLMLGSRFYTNEVRSKVVFSLSTLIFKTVD